MKDRRRPHVLPPAFRAAIFLSILLSIPPGDGSLARAVDCDRNGVDDVRDVIGGRADCNENDVPDECDILPVNFGLSGEEISVYPLPLSLVAADFDADGRIDIAMAQERSSFVSVLWNRTEGSQEPAGYGTREPGKALAAGDIDGDGDPDLLLGGTTVLSVVRNDGGRSFQLSPMSAELPAPPVSLALADLDRDGDLDIAAAGGFRLSILFHDGPASFTLELGFRMEAGPISVVTIDADADGDLDLVTGNRSGSFSLLENLGPRSFGAPRDFESAGKNEALLAADFDADGRDDLAALKSEGKVAVFVNSGAGRFAPARIFGVPAMPAGFHAADLDRDGDVDLALTHRAGPMSVLRNRGGADFGRPVVMRAAPGALSIIRRDLAGDGAFELVLANRDQDAIHFLRPISVANSADCNSDGVPDECQIEDSDCNGNGVPDDCDAASAMDCDGNAVPDECEPDCNRNGITDACEIETGTESDCNANGIPDSCDIAGGNLLISSSPLFDYYPGAISLAAGDLDGDGDPDLVAGTTEGLDAIINYRERLRASFFDPTGAAALSVAVGDLDGDGDLDMADAGDSGEITVHWNSGDGSSAGSRAFRVAGVGALPGSLLLRDFDADGDLDAAVALASPPPGGVALLPNDGRGNLGEPALHEAGILPRLLVPADLDSDGHLDLVAADPGSSEISILLNRGGALAAPVLHAAGGKAIGLAGGDFDRDGDADIAVGHIDPPGITFFTNVGDGSLRRGAQRVLAAEPIDLTAVDLDGDGDLDLAAIQRIRRRSRLDGQLTIHLNGGDGSFTEALTSFISRNEEPFSILSWDPIPDGKEDLLVLTRADCDFCLPTSFYLLRNQTAPPASRDAGGDGVPDECQGALFRRGDSSPDGKLDMADVLGILDGLFRGGVPPSCLEAADADNDGRIGITDPIFLLRHLFMGGPSPPLPGPPPAPCGRDPDEPGSPEDLGCNAYPSCA